MDDADGELIGDLNANATSVITTNDPSTLFAVPSTARDKAVGSRLTVPVINWKTEEQQHQADGDTEDDVVDRDVLGLGHVHQGGGVEGVPGRPRTAIWLPLPSRRRSARRGNVATVAAVPPATSQTLETMGQSHTDITSLLVGWRVGSYGLLTFQKKLIKATLAPQITAAPQDTRTPTLPREARCGLLELAPKPHTIALMINARTDRMRPTVMMAPTMVRSWEMPSADRSRSG